MTWMANLFMLLLFDRSNGEMLILFSFYSGIILFWESAVSWLRNEGDFSACWRNLGGKGGSAHYCPILRWISKENWFFIGVYGSELLLFLIDTEIFIMSDFNLILKSQENECHRCLLDITPYYFYNQHSLHNLKHSSW